MHGLDLAVDLCAGYLDVDLVFDGTGEDVVELLIREMSVIAVAEIDEEGDAYDETTRPEAPCRRWLR